MASHTSTTSSLTAPMGATDPMMATAANFGNRVPDLASEDVRGIFTSTRKRKAGAIAAAGSVADAAKSTGLTTASGSGGQPAIASEKDVVLNLIGRFSLHPHHSLEVLHTLIASYRSIDDYALMLTEVLERRLIGNPINRPDWEISQEDLERNLHQHLFRLTNSGAKEESLEFFSKLQKDLTSQITTEIFDQMNKVCDKGSSDTIPSKQQLNPFIIKLVIEQLKAQFTKFDTNAESSKKLIVLRLILLQAAIKRASRVANHLKVRQLFLDLSHLYTMNKEMSSASAVGGKDKRLYWNGSEYDVANGNRRFYRIKPLEERQIRFDEWVNLQLNLELAESSKALVYQAAKRSIAPSHILEHRLPEIRNYISPARGYSSFVLYQLTHISLAHSVKLWHPNQEKMIDLLLQVLEKQAQGEKNEKEVADCRAQLFAAVKDSLIRLSKEKHKRSTSPPVNEDNIFFWMQEKAKKKIISHIDFGLKQIGAAQLNANKCYQVLIDIISCYMRKKYPNVNEQLKNQLLALHLVKLQCALGNVVNADNDCDPFQQMLANVIFRTILWVDPHIILQARLLSGEISLAAWIREYLSFKYPRGDQYLFPYSASKFMKLVEITSIGNQIICGQLTPG